MIEDKIAKLLAMAEHPNSNPHEAAMAAARAAHLAAEHNLDLDELRARGAAPKKVMGRFAGPSVIKRADIDAFGFIMTGCGRLYGASFCFVSPPRGSSTFGYFFAGQEHNCKLAIKWAEYLWESCKRANTEHTRGRSLGSSRAREEARQAFRYGFGSTVLGRLLEKLQEMTATVGVSDSRALAIAHQVIAEYNEADAFMKNTGEFRDLGGRGKGLEPNAYRAGQQAGERASLADQIGGR